MKARMLSYEDGEEVFETECIVRVKTASIEIVYDVEDVAVAWFGEEKSPGHYVLHAPAAGGKATLHGFPQSNRLVGEWSENWEDQRSGGMWSIRLDESLP